jgi:4-nitrophenyl phosphatase
MAGLIQTLKEFGFNNGASNPLAVVVGLDKNITYEKLRIASLFIRGGVPFIGTNADKSFPTPEGLVPGAGSLIAALEAASDTKAEIIGKPQATMFYHALNYLKCAPEDVLVVGDRLETDIAGGQAAGCKTALVLSGVSTREMGEAWKPAPDLILPDLTHLAKMM